MSSIRPLVTITLLTIAGVFLWHKINEKEPELPEDIADWSMPAGGGLEIGSSPAAPGMGAATGPASVPQSFQSAPTFDAAPPKFEAAPAAASSPQAPATGAAPPFAAEAPQFGAAPEIPSEQKLEVPDLPPLPAFPEPKADSDLNAATSNPGAGINPPQPDSMAKSTDETTPTSSAPPLESFGSSTPEPPSLFASTRLTVQAALDRGELSQGLLLLSDWYGDPSLSPEETKEVNTLLSQLAGSVIYSREHRLEPPYLVQAGENLRGIAQKYDVPWPLLAKINGLSDPDSLQPGQELKVMRGPFEAKIDLGQRRMTLMLDRRYAGEFPLEVEPTTSVEQGHWTVNQKMLTPGDASLSNPSAGDKNKSIMLNSASGDSSQIVLIRGSGATGPTTTDPTGRVIRMKNSDVDDVYDILTIGSRVTIRR